MFYLIYKRNNLLKSQHGVTLMETIIALGILTTGIITALALMASSISFSQTSEQSIIVVNLAREGIEIVRSIRELNDFNALTAGAKLANINYVSGNLELVNADSSEIKNCSNCILQMYNGRYLHNSPGNPTIFKRLVIISDVSSHEKKIVSKVYWSERGREHTFSLEDHLTSW